ncbi:MAG TPA: alpha/beta hydrolase domain-containing protein [Stellaceae bacterium]|jgi:hypothetical protein
MTARWAAIVVAVVCAWQSVVGHAAEAVAEEPVSCLSSAPPPTLIGNAKIGIDSCAVMAESIVLNRHGKKFRRLEIWLGGTVDGWAVTDKAAKMSYFTDGPDIVFAQFGVTAAPSHGVGRYSPPKGEPASFPDGHAMTLLLPADPTDWNGKIFITAHGAGSYAKLGELVPRDPQPHRAAENFYAGLMIDKGYAVAHTMRSAAMIGGDVKVTLDDGTALPGGFNVSSNASLVLPWIALAKKMTAEAMGSAPKRTYFYGHSAGAMLGHLINYGPGFNRGADGNRVIDGFLMDDPGGGMWLPTLMRDGKDVLFTSEADRQLFAKQIDVAHQLYLGETGDFLVKKRENARLLVQKGLGDRNRLYEVRGVSHFDANYPAAAELPHRGVDMSGLFADLIDHLDAWVDNDVPPPPTMSDDAALGHGKAAIALPINACPLGVAYVFPGPIGNSRRGTQLTDWAPFDGVNQEPLDARGELVDMNGDGKRDRRETVTEAWRRLGLLKPEESFDRSRYVACVDAASKKLVAEQLLPKSMADFYVAQSKQQALTGLQ